MSSTASALAIESWMLYGLGVSLIISRLVFRRITLGSFAKLQCDDWLMVLVLVPFTGTVVCATQVSIDLHKSKPNRLDHIWGLKMRFVLEHLQVSTSWLVKACLLILYLRIFPSITSGKERRYLICVSIFCILSFLAIVVLVPVWCYPLHEYWRPLSNNPQCSTYHFHTVTSLTFNLTTSLFVFILPLPFIPTPRRLLLAILLILGTLVLATGIIARYYILTAPSSPLYLYWYTAEAASTICFANLPFLSSLVSSTSLRSRRLSGNTSLSHPSFRNRRLSSNVSLSQWPRPPSIKTSPPSPPLRVQRLDSTATTISSKPTICSISPTEDRPPPTPTWCDPTLAPSYPPIKIRTLRLADAPLELGTFLESRRPSTREGRIEIQWPLKS